MANAYGDPGPDYDAHHNYPQKFREQFESVGIDIDAAENGTWVQLMSIDLEPKAIIQFGKSSSKCGVEIFRKK